MDSFTESISHKLPYLSSDQKTDLIDSIAKKMISTMIIISREIDRGNLDADNTTPIHNFIRTILRHERAQLRKLERRVARYQRRARRWRAERRRIQHEIAEIVRVLHEAWMEKNLKGSSPRTEARAERRPDSGSGDGSCGNFGESENTQ
ncbi:predicted protein [Aspergillus nidulans FGSC A4]|jgi:hypothetical protein|uniref:Uncharacterized protein n=1 Tax=Emericella nidulans (strain FGSC A4 / ATCC 38163 / CBS 112.46 / NRRL 194 / M139) TaxID=227321 RepID=Q5B1Z1_EMENI|nr:hypothetical protein [Aspergillus nidulans FGSC A4]EAA62599.1 predicted protein [Aspergillus nidulans FGSC A4]CBF81907.1 TPA: conserved hypothetical protein [Aspergillus nidulans FGSC A4]|eukprot:XP_663043.1 predicted protein [Aspergillus nidulans FGSC A4]